MATSGRAANATGSNLVKADAMSALLQVAGVDCGLFVWNRFSRSSRSATVSGLHGYKLSTFAETSTRFLNSAGIERLVDIAGLRIPSVPKQGSGPNDREPACRCSTEWQHYFTQRTSATAAASDNFTIVNLGDDPDPRSGGRSLEKPIGSKEHRTMPLTTTSILADFRNAQSTGVRDSVALRYVGDMKVTTPAR
jgi:hypothetical protein